MTFFRLKIFISLVLAYLVSWYLSSNVFLAGTPVVRPDAGRNVLQIPLMAKDATGKLFAHFSIFKGIKPPKSSNTDTIAVIPTWKANISPTRDPAEPNAPYNPPPTSSYQNPTPTQGWIYISPSPTPTPVPWIPTSPPQPTATSAPVTKDQFAQCLTTKGMKFYTNAACPFCKQTKQDFGTSFKYVTEVNCDAQAQLCRSKPGVGRGPAWEKGNGEIIPGAMDFQSLSYVSSCQKPTL